MNRRQLLIGGGFLAAAGAAAALTPRERMSLLGGRKLAGLIPERIRDWRHVESDAVVLPAREGSLSDLLYSEVVSRLYKAPDGVPVMLVIAYGDTQSDLLQLHRPEACYSAIGFEIAGSREARVALGPNVLPARELVATSEQRTEPILYWTRIGDELPTSGQAQRMSKLRSEFAGRVPDGVLVRMSTALAGNVVPPPEMFAALKSFSAAMIEAIRPADRAVLIGPSLAGRLAARMPSTASGARG